MNDRYFFTADEHYGLANIIRFCDRPFATVEEMDEELIRRHNEIVGPDDIVVHAGDFAYRSARPPQSCLEQMNGTHVTQVTPNSAPIQGPPCPRSQHTQAYDPELAGSSLLLPGVCPGDPSAPPGRLVMIETGAVTGAGIMVTGPGRNVGTLSTPLNSLSRRAFLRTPRASGR